MAQHSSEPGRAEQIIAQLHLKALHAVLAARVPALRHRPPDARARKRDRWFNLALGGALPAALDRPGLIHQAAGVVDPLVIDILLRPLDPASAPAPETIIERWLVQCDPPALPAPHWGAAIPLSNPRAAAADPAAFYRRTYKKSIVLLRSLYSVLRLLPAYRVFRTLASSNQAYNYDIGYKISSFAAPFSRQEEEEFKLYSFAPVECQFGQLSISVSYRPELSDFHLEVSSLLPPMIIADYVGSPAADPMRAFPSSLTERGVRATSFPLRAAHTTASPSSARPHSWTSAPLAHHPLSTSLVTDFRASPQTDLQDRRLPSQRPLVLKKGNFSFDEFQLSPPFSLSPSPSPPMHSSNPLRARLLSETAPVSIPLPLTGKSQLHGTPNLSDPTRSHLPPPSPRSSRADLSSQESPSESRSFRKLEGLKVGDLYSNLQLFKGLRDVKDDSGRFSGVLSSCGSPRFGFSRSSSRLSMQDDLDDGDFSCPFAVDDVDTYDSHARNLEGKVATESAQGSASSRKSQDAAVGILVHMLKTAPPLRQEHSSSSQSSKSEQNPEVSSSSFFMSRKASDALEELQGYREMKDSLLSQSGTKLLDSVKQRTK